jgi:hypothetical protein
MSVALKNPRLAAPYRKHVSLRFSVTDIARKVSRVLSPLPIVTLPCTGDLPTLTVTYVMDDLGSATASHAHSDLSRVVGAGLRHECLAPAGTAGRSAIHSGKSKRPISSPSCTGPPCGPHFELKNSRLDRPSTWCLSSGVCLRPTRCLLSISCQPLCPECCGPEPRGKARLALKNGMSRRQRRAANAAVQAQLCGQV